jgi:uncharacterized protein
MPARTARAIRVLLDRHVTTSYTVIGVTVEVVYQAEDLLERYPLRAYDAIQLASALVANRRLSATGLPELLFVSADTRLLNAAIAEGITTDSPDAHPSTTQ